MGRRPHYGKDDAQKHLVLGHVTRLLSFAKET
jgi:hypothetical protein